MSKEAEQRANVCTQAQAWLGTPWRHAARVPGAGVDCAQLLIAVYSAAGLIDEFDPGAYASDHMLHSSQPVFEHWCRTLARPVDVPQLGDVVLWHLGRVFSHGGIVMEWPGRVVHAYRPYGMVCETPANVARLDGRAVQFFSFW
jgi:cell wall-associated NlpC family hydrolase